MAAKAASAAALPLVSSAGVESAAARLAAAADDVGRTYS